MMKKQLSFSLFVFYVFSVNWIPFFVYSYNSRVLLLCTLVLSPPFSN